MPEKKTINFNISGQEVQFSNDQGRAVGMEIVLSTPNAKFHFFFILKSVGISVSSGIASFGAEF